MTRPPPGPGANARSSGDQTRLFDDGKDPQAFRTIGEVAQALGIKPHVLRYWEEQFASLEPVKRSGGRRYYRPEDVALLQRINALIREEGYTIRGAAKALSARAVPLTAPETSKHPAVEPDPQTPDRQTDISAQGRAAPDGPTLDRLREIRNHLVAALALIDQS